MCTIRGNVQPAALVLAMLMPFAMGALLFAPTAADAQPHTGVQELMAAERYALAAKRLERMLRAPRLKSEARVSLTADLAKATRMRGKPGDAIELLDGLPLAASSEPAVMIERAYALADSGEFDQIGPWVARLKSHDDARFGATAVYLQARWDFEQRRLEPCIKNCRDAIGRLGRASVYHNPYAWELRLTRTRAMDLLRRAEEALIEERYGQDYANYRRGRESQAGGSFEQAIGYYRKVQAPILRDAALAYTGACMAALGHHAAAAQHLREMIEQDPDGLYRGEAMMTLANLYLDQAETADHLGRIDELLAELIAWCERVESQTPPVTVESIEAVLKAFPVPDDRAEPDRFGNFHRQHATSSSVLNRLTSTWYLPDLRARAMLLHGFVSVERCEREQAVASLEAAIAHDQAAGGSILRLGDTPRRLIADAQDGVFLFPAAVRGQLSKELGLLIHQGCFWTAAGETGRADQLFARARQRMEPHAADSGHSLDRAAIIIAAAHGQFRNGQVREALGSLGRFDSHLHNSPLAPLAALLSANIQAGQPDGYDLAKQKYMSVITRAKGDDFRARALLSFALAAANRADDRAAVQALDRLLAKHAESDHGRVGAALRQRLVGLSLETGRKTAVAPDGAGRVVAFARHVVVPGGADLTIDLEKYKDTDVLAYEIGYSVRGGCALKNFWYRTTLWEPQPPMTTQSPLRFYRAPLLVTRP